MAPTQSHAPQLFSEAPAQAPAGLTWYELHIPLDRIEEAPGHNPRRDYGEDDGTFAALVESIRERGMQQYPRLWPVADIHGDWDPLECRFTIISGHRRIAAARALGWESVRACVPDAEGPALASYTEADKLIDALVENLQRRDLNCIEVAEGIGRLEAMGRTQEQIARLIGKSQGRVSRCVRLLELPVGVRSFLREGTLRQSVAEEMLPLVGSGLLPGEIEAMAHKAIESKLTAEGMQTLVRHKLAAMGRSQAELFGANNSAPASEPEGEEPEDEIDARIARTLASTKGMDKEPAPAPKETNGLTRGESDRQFVEAMAPDPDVIPLSERPSVPTQLPASAPVMHVVVSGLGAEALLALVGSEPYKGHDLADIVGAILVRRAVELELIANPAEISQEPKSSYESRCKVGARVILLEDRTAEGDVVIPKGTAATVIGITVDRWGQKAVLDTVPQIRSQWSGLEILAEATSAVEPEAEEVIHSATVAYCYPQGGAWQGGGAVDAEDGVPSLFDDLAEAREFAREQSDRFHNRRFLFHVLDHLEYPKRKSDRAVMRGDLWYFRGQQVPGGISNSIPSAENLAAVGCVLEELCKEVQAC